MNNLIKYLALIFFISLGSSQVIANHCSGGHDKSTETSTTTSEDSEDSEKKE
ncbi:hypothetical protein OA848_00265 [Rickettsiales bacterium]|nr:hypothetical protein [Rickettsiales bacterium]